jgi:hypothetical protein
MNHDELERVDDELPEEQEEELAQALRAAWQPSALEPSVNEALIALALEDPLAPPSEEEARESERLRRALDGEGQHPDMELVRALRAAGNPATLEEQVSERSVQSALGSGKRGGRRGNVIFVSFGAAATAIAAMAAAWFFALRPAIDSASSSSFKTAVHDLALSRSTAAMFQDPLTTQTTTTERVDRIALARARDLRSNRYAKWGIH